jgi:hypothetical protein
MPRFLYWEQLDEFVFPSLLTLVSRRIS